MFYGFTYSYVHRFFCKFVFLFCSLTNLHVEQTHCSWMYLLAQCAHVAQIKTKRKTNQFQLNIITSHRHRHLIDSNLHLTLFFCIGIDLIFFVRLRFPLNWDKLDWMFRLNSMWHWNSRIYSPFAQYFFFPELYSRASRRFCFLANKVLCSFSGIPFTIHRKTPSI